MDSLPENRLASLQLRISGMWFTRLLLTLWTWWTRIIAWRNKFL